MTLGKELVWYPTWQKFSALLFCSAFSFSASAQTWTRLVNPPGFIPSTPLLLTDGSVMVQSFGTNLWWRLTPDNTGSYINGTWSPLASMAPNYAPFAYASAVLPDGRVVVIGGENNAGVVFADTSMGEIYDPATDSWTPLPDPSNLVGSVGDAPSVVLANGIFMLGNAIDSGANIHPVLLDAATLTWTPTGNNPPYGNSFSEQGFTLLPTGQVLTLDVADHRNTSKVYDPSAGIWTSAGDTIVQLWTPGEIGPAVLRPDGTVFAIGATSNTAIYNVAHASWSPGPVFPDALGVPDGAAALLPTGNVLVGPYSSEGGQFFEFDGQALNPVPGPLGAGAVNAPSAAGLMLVLPTGQILYTLPTVGADAVQIYTSSGTYQQSWAPTISASPSSVSAGGLNYSISGTQFNGLSQGAMYGDDAQMATNYPLVRITNNATGRVFYARTHHHSTMGVATGAALVSTKFDVSVGTETGASRLSVVANGIASDPVNVFVSAAPTFAIGPGITGNWFDPSQSGHGFSVEVLPGNVMLAQWYVFAPNGGQAWIVASGPIAGNTAVLQGFQSDGAGARFPPNFDPSQVHNEAWGKITLTFTDCNNGQASWQPTVTGYTSGSIPITRLTMPAGLTCP